jgi:hypothetical protein
MRWNIHNVLVIAEKQTFGAYLGGVLREHGYLVTIVESYGRFSDVFQDIARRKFDLGDCNKHESSTRPHPEYRS